MIDINAPKIPSITLYSKCLDALLIKKFDDEYVISREELKQAMEEAFFIAGVVNTVTSNPLLSTLLEMSGGTPELEKREMYGVTFEKLMSKNLGIDHEKISEIINGRKTDLLNDLLKQKRNEQDDT